MRDQEKGMVSSGRGFPSAGGGGKNYLESLRSFSRNARLFLIYSLLSFLGTGIWTVMFNLYLLWLGFDLAYVGLLVFLDLFFHGVFAFPAGLIADKIGRRKTFALATSLNIVVRGLSLVTLNPLLLAILAALRGCAEGFHAVAGAPFMMENSEPEERPHLFSLNSSFLFLSQFVGLMSGGLLPLFWGLVLGVPQVDPDVGRWSLVCSLPLTFIALIPLILIREKPIELVESFRELFLLRNIVSHGVIVRLALCSFIIGLPFGLMTRFFSVFFVENFRASTDQAGTIMAIGSLTGAATILLSPLLSRKWGKVRSMAATQTISAPFAVLMAFAPFLTLSGVFFLFRGAFYGISIPLRQQLEMEFVVSKERATTAGIVHMMFDLGGAFPAFAAGGLMARGDFLTPFSIAGVASVVVASLYYLFFVKREDRQRARELAARPVAP